MSIFAGPTIVNLNQGLVLHLDAAAIKSYNTAISTSTWYDISYNTTGTTLYNSVTYNSANAGSMVFTATNNTYAVAPINPAYTAGTISAWARFGLNNNGTICVYTANNPTGSYTHCMYTTPSNTFNAYMYDGGTKTATGATVLSVNTWYNFVMTWQDGVAVNAYLNGQFESTVAIGSSWKSGSNFWLGAAWGGGPAMTGNISEISVYNRVLSVAEIQQNYQALKSRYGITA